MRIGVFTDIHANLPALEAVLAAVREHGCELIVHTGDAVGYGPHPREVVQILVELSGARLLTGNHDEYAVQGPAHPHMPGMESTEQEHHAWVREQLSGDLVTEMASWPHIVTLAGAPALVFCHYARSADGSDFAPILRDADPSSFDALFAPPEPAIVFHGHDHPPADVRGVNRFIDPGSAGVWGFPAARYAVVELNEDREPDVWFGLAPYDGERVLRDLEERQVPAREYVLATLLGHE
jgi:predicted phosphodiesterase